MEGFPGLCSTFIAPVSLLFFLPQGSSYGQRSQAVQEEIRVIVRWPAWGPCQEPSDLSEVFTLVLLPNMRFIFLLFGLVEFNQYLWSSGKEVGHDTHRLPSTNPVFPATIKDPSRRGHQAHTSNQSRAYLPKAEDEESQQQQPSQDTANEDPQGDEHRARLDHLQEALCGERGLSPAPFHPAGLTPHSSKASLQIED